MRYSRHSLDWSLRRLAAAFLCLRLLPAGS